MHDINLLPTEYGRKTHTIKSIILLLLAIFAFLLFVIFGIINPIKKRDEYRQQKELIQQREHSLSELEEKYIEDQNVLEELHERLESLSDLKVSTPIYWYKILKTINRSLPQGTSLNQFTCDSTTILLYGSCTHDKLSATYLRNLKNKTYFSEVRIEKLIYHQNDKVDFIIRCVLNQNTMEDDHY
jgi:Tfp pilus assembly protein PilN